MASTDEPGPEQPRTSFSEHLGWRAGRRPTARFAYVLGAAAGALAVVAVVAFVIRIDGDDLTAPGVLLDLALFAAAAIAGAKLAGPVRGASMAAIVLTTPLIWGFALAGDGDVSRSSVRGVLLLSLLTYGVLYVLGWTRGHAIVLGLAVLVLSSWILFEVQGDTFPFQGSVENTTIPTPFPGTEGSTNDPLDFERPDSTDTAVVSALLGFAWLALGARLDQRRRTGSATPFVFNGAVFSVIGAIALGLEQGRAVGGIVAMLAGAAIMIVGSWGEQRRGSIWFGALAVFGGAIAVVAAIAGDSTLAFGAFAAAFAVGIGVVSQLVAIRTSEPDDDSTAVGATSS